MSRLVAVVLAAIAGCKALEDTIAQHEENVKAARKGPQQEDAVASHRIRVPDAQTRPSAMDRLRELPPHSPEGQLRELIRLRIQCQEGECAKRALEKIREDQPYLAKGLPVLLEGEPQPITLEALRLAGLLRVEGIAPVLGRRLDDPEPEVRAEAIWALGALGSSAALAELVELRVRGLERAQRGLVCDAVAEIGLPEGLALLRWLMAGELPETRTKCVEALGRLPGAEALAELEALCTDPLPEVEIAARRLLSGRSEPRARAFLEALQRREKAGDPKNPTGSKK